MAESRGGREDRTTKEAYNLIFNGRGYNQLKDAEKYFSSSQIKLKPKKSNIAGLQFADLLSHSARRYILSQNGLAVNLDPNSFESKIVDLELFYIQKRETARIASRTECKHSTSKLPWIDFSVSHIQRKVKLI